MELDTETHIYLGSVSKGELHKHIYLATPFSVLENIKKMILMPEKESHVHLHFKNPQNVFREGTIMTTGQQRCTKKLNVGRVFVCIYNLFSISICTYLCG